MKCQGHRPYLIDASNPSHSNWLRFVNCARSEDEQNVSAFQFEGQIFYRTIKSVYPGTELLVWYGDQYASKLGISVDAEGESAGLKEGWGRGCYCTSANLTHLPKIKTTTRKQQQNKKAIILSGDSHHSKY